MSPMSLILTQAMAVGQLSEIAKQHFSDLVKAVVDVELGIITLDFELHVDGEQILLDQGSSQGNLWGINLYPDLPKGERIEFDSMINVRPQHNNRSRNVEDEKIRDQIRVLVNGLILD